ncbi:hypothetical protein [Halorubellus salinus]|uniref:hypothetical protein n=1 Tax=Halorubellus salinus TaxID=755309 RepID=UPI001D07FAA2|nr:hypothetical protein [Halorubellus salinus]
MGDRALDDIGLEKRDVQVLRRVQEYGKPLTSTLKESVWWADENQHIHYRLDKLEKSGFVESWGDEYVDSRGPLDPRRATTTDMGDSILDELDRDDERPDGVEERLTRVEKSLDAMGDTYGKVKQRIVELEEAVDELEDEFGSDLEELNNSIENLKRSVDDGGESLADELVFGDGE